MIDLEIIEKVNTRYGRIKAAEWHDILDTWFALKAVARAADRYYLTSKKFLLDWEFEKALAALEETP